MKFIITDKNNEEREITVKEWNGSGYGPDCFDGLEPNFPKDHQYDDDLGGYLCTDAEYQDLKDWWESKIKDMVDGVGEYAEYDYSGLCMFAD